MEGKRAARRDCHHDRAKVPDRDTEIVANGWTRAQCRAIGVGVGGGWALLALLAVVI